MNSTVYRECHSSRYPLIVSFHAISVVELKYNSKKKLYGSIELILVTIWNGGMKRVYSTLRNLMFLGIKVKYRYY